MKCWDPKSPHFSHMNIFVDIEPNSISEMLDLPILSSSFEPYFLDTLYLTSCMVGSNEYFSKKVIGFVVRCQAVGAGFIFISTISKRPERPFDLYTEEEPMCHIIDLY